MVCRNKKSTEALRNKVKSDQSLDQASSSSSSSLHNLFFPIIGITYYYCPALHHLTCPSCLLLPFLLWVHFLNSIFIIIVVDQIHNPILLFSCVASILSHSEAFSHQISLITTYSSPDSLQNVPR